MKRVLVLSIFFLIGAGAILWKLLPTKRLDWVPQPMRPTRMARPAGMAPPAFEAFTRACVRAKIHPWRVGQTIGDHPFSVGYHKQDGVFRRRGEAFAYCAAVDLGVGDLDDRRREIFLEEMAKQGFAAFYRQGGKWRGNEHVHAIYAMLPMKIQLRRQVREFLRERRKLRKPPLKWASKRPYLAKT